ncbi:MAG: heme exporter protein CcmB [Vicingaceae bacterium]
MNNVKEIRHLIYKDYILDLRSKNVVVSTVVYIFSTVYVCYLSFSNLESQHWYSLFWIIALFAVTNAANKIFINDAGENRIYLYSLASPQSVIISKLLYQWFFSTFLALIVWFSTMTIFSTSIPHQGPSLVVVLLGIWAISNVLTLNNALSSSTKNSPTVLAILSFPVLLPVLLTTIKAGRLSMLSEIPADYYSMVLALGLLNLLTATLAYLLFPYLWRY